MKSNFAVHEALIVSNFLTPAKVTLNLPRFSLIQLISSSEVNKLISEKRNTQLAKEKYARSSLGFLKSFITPKRELGITKTCSASV